MKALRRLQRLITLANAGDKTARADADALLRKYNATECDVPPVRGRGRPRAFDRAWQESIRQLSNQPLDVIQRTKDNYLYYIEALNILLDNEPINPKPENLKRWAWLLRPEGNITHSRKTILTRLGRVGHEPTVKIYADRLC